MFGLPTPVSIADSTIVELAQPSQHQAQVCGWYEAQACSGASGGADLDVVGTG